MFTVHVLIFFLLLGLATSEENIYVDYESNPDHPFPVIRRDVASLKTNIIAQFRGPTYQFCGLQCAEHRFCVAFNYKEKDEGNDLNCQLTNTTRHEFDNNASQKKRVWMFIKNNVDRSQVASCRGEVNECRNGGTMIWDPEKPFNCLCKEGYEGEMCENDIDECSEENFTCHLNATCINTQGSYKCECKNGYVSDGKENCTEILWSEPLDFTTKLGEWLPLAGNWSVCWQATRDGWASTTFLARCNGNVPTLTIVKVVKDNKNLIFGGFAKATWAGRKFEFIIAIHTCSQVYKRN
ncbi:fibropellin-1-like isoform X1 [Paramuricea clavata]|uniref:Fibropellin-1-like isoform X1 n=1 Tax=Paramuricea clavata TaxID=317549 RepID=A0A6S7FHC5_PARCT|nr:fibropellin-1-like isoform X1 [Paramuricea clavata]